MTLDRRVQELVLAALQREPGIDAAAIGVSVVDGVVTLRGTVPTVRDKWLAERTARHLDTVRAVANDLEVSRHDATTTDAGIARAVADAIEWDSAIPADRVKATVRHGWVTLSGTTTWQFQRAAAERAARNVLGVKGVVNAIRIEHVRIGDLQSRIEEAFRHAADVDAHAIKIEAQQGTVVLSGTVHSNAERQAAKLAALDTPGVSRVDDRLTVAW